jgi:hypothetical protein
VKHVSIDELNAGVVIAVDGDGNARVSAHKAKVLADAKIELERIAAVKARGLVPQECGDEAPVAPARGPVGVFSGQAFYPKGGDEFEAKPSGALGRSTMKVADVFDLMEAAAQRAKKPAPFTAGQIDMGRTYCNLVERQDAGGMKCASLEALGGGTGGDFMDGYLAGGMELDRLRARIGDGVALSRVRPSKRSSILITDRMLVDNVCLAGLPPAAILKKYGWSVRGQNVRSLYLALASALDRMAGPVRSGRIKAVAYGAASRFDRTAS